MHPDNTVLTPTGPTRAGLGLGSLTTYSLPTLACQTGHARASPTTPSGHPGHPGMPERTRRVLRHGEFVMLARFWVGGNWTGRARPTARASEREGENTHASGTPRPWEPPTFFFFFLRRSRLVNVSLYVYLSVPRSRSSSPHQQAAAAKPCPQHTHTPLPLNRPPTPLLSLSLPPPPIPPTPRMQALPDAGPLCKSRQLIGEGARGRGKPGKKRGLGR
ncbi:hypothetical protein GGS23DRAFT_147136 [Durotheca rogersii]|uniref:uncharacterized protein n=1 Tax=Durotheca rogersii TaxID=419775 RepID=UPI00221F2E22|nr:uncharacterized protein GGS23DRAFT_147136 [Durotheca rogersii]KAI5861340.1 hypothetical protein GGS23DRAFT_147136 [Durotheca rogersii]